MDSGFFCDPPLARHKPALKWQKGDDEQNYRLPTPGQARHQKRPNTRSPPGTLKVKMRPQPTGTDRLITPLYMSWICLPNIISTRQPPMLGLPVYEWLGDDWSTSAGIEYFTEGLNLVDQSWSWATVITCHAALSVALYCIVIFYWLNKKYKIIHYSNHIYSASQLKVGDSNNTEGYLDTTASTEIQT